MNKIQITGSGSLIGLHLVNRFLEEGNFKIVGLEVSYNYYDIKLNYTL